MTKFSVIICLLIIIGFAAFSIEAHFFENIGDSECSKAKVKTCKGALLARVNKICNGKHFTSACDPETLANECCAGCSDCYIKSCC